MKVGKWNMLPLSPRKRKGAKDKVKVDTMVAIQGGKRILVHRVEKRKEDGTLIPLDVKKGDSILFSKYAGSEVTIDSNEYIIMREDDILGVL